MSLLDFSPQLVRDPALDTDVEFLPGNERDDDLASAILADVAGEIGLVTPDMVEALVAGLEESLADELEEMSAHYDPDKHPRWPAGTPGGLGGKFMRVGQRFNWKGVAYDVAAVFPGHIYAHVATHGIKGAPKTIEIKADTKVVGDDGKEHPSISGISRPDAEPIHGTKTQTSSSSFTGTVVDPYVDSSTHDPSIPIPEGSKVTPEQWKRFGKLDQERYSQCMELFGQWSPGKAQQLVDSVLAKADPTAKKILKEQHASQIGSSSGITLSMHAVFGSVLNLVKGHPSVEKARADFESARALQDDVAAALQWDLYNRAKGPDIALFHRNSTDSLFKQQVIAGNLPVFSGLSQSQKWSDSHNTQFGSNTFATPMAIRNIVMSRDSANVNKSSSYQGELEVATADAYAADSRSMALSANELSSMQKKWLAKITQNGASGDVLQTLKESMADGGAALPVPPADPVIAMDGSGGVKYLTPPLEATKGAGALGYADVDANGSPIAKPAKDLALSPGDYVEGMQGTRYLIVADPSYPLGFSYFKVTDTGAPVAGTSTKSPETGQETSKYVNHTDWTGPVECYQFEGNGAKAFKKLAGHYDLPVSTAEFKSDFHPDAWAFSAKEDAKPLAKFQDDEMFHLDGVFYKVMGQLGGGQTRIQNLSTGKLGKINSDYKSTFLVLKPGYSASGQVELTPTDFFHGEPTDIGASFDKLEAGSVMLIGQTLWKVEAKTSDGHVTAVQSSGVAKNIGKLHTFDATQKYVEMVEKPLGWTQPEVGDTLAIDGKKATVTKILKNGEIQVNLHPGVEKLKPSSPLLSGVFSPTKYVIGDKVKLKQMAEGTLFHASAGVKTIRPYMVMSGVEGGNVSVKNLDTGEVMPMSANKSFPQLLPKIDTSAQAFSALGAASGPGPDMQSDVFIPENWEAGPEKNAADWQPGDIIVVSGKPYKVKDVEGSETTLKNLTTGEVTKHTGLAGMELVVPTLKAKGTEQLSASIIPPGSEFPLVGKLGGWKNQSGPSALKLHELKVGEMVKSLGGSEWVVGEHGMNMDGEPFVKITRVGDNHEQQGKWGWQPPAVKTFKPASLPKTQAVLASSLGEGDVFLQSGVLMTVTKKWTTGKIDAVSANGVPASFAADVPVGKPSSDPTMIGKTGTAAEFKDLNIGTFVQTPSNGVTFVVAGSGNASDSGMESVKVKQVDPPVSPNAGSWVMSPQAELVVVSGDFGPSSPDDDESPLYATAFNPENYKAIPNDDQISMAVLCDPGDIVQFDKAWEYVQIEKITTKTVYATNLATGASLKLSPAKKPLYVFMPESAGVPYENMLPGSPAQLGELKVGDRFLGADGAEFQVHALAQGSEDQVTVCPVMSDGSLGNPSKAGNAPMLLVTLKAKAADVTPMPPGAAELIDPDSLEILGDWAGDGGYVTYLHPKSGKKHYPKIKDMVVGTVFHDKQGHVYKIKGFSGFGTVVVSDGDKNWGVNGEYRGFVLDTAQQPAWAQADMAPIVEPDVDQVEKAVVSPKLVPNTANATISTLGLGVGDWLQMPGSKPMKVISTYKEIAGKPTMWAALDPDTKDTQHYNVFASPQLYWSAESVLAEHAAPAVTNLAANDADVKLGDMQIGDHFSTSSGTIYEITAMAETNIATKVVQTGVAALGTKQVGDTLDFKPDGVPAYAEAKYLGMQVGSPTYSFHGMSKKLSDYEPAGESLIKDMQPGDLFQGFNTEDVWGVTSVGDDGSVQIQDITNGEEPVTIPAVTAQATNGMVPLKTLKAFNPVQKQATASPVEPGLGDLEGFAKNDVGVTVSMLKEGDQFAIKPNDVVYEVTAGTTPSGSINSIIVWPPLHKGTPSQSDPAWTPPYIKQVALATKALPSEGPSADPADYNEGETMDLAKLNAGEFFQSLSGSMFQVMKTGGPGGTSEVKNLKSGKVIKQALPSMPAKLMVAKNVQAFSGTPEPTLKKYGDLNVGATFKMVGEGGVGDGPLMLKVGPQGYVNKVTGEHSIMPDHGNDVEYVEITDGTGTPPGGWMPGSHISYSSFGSNDIAHGTVAETFPDGTLKVAPDIDGNKYVYVNAEDVLPLVDAPPHKTAAAPEFGPNAAGFKINQKVTLPSGVTGMIVQTFPDHVDVATSGESKTTPWLNAFVHPAVGGDALEKGDVVTYLPGGMSTGPGPNGESEPAEILAVKDNAYTLNFVTEDTGYNAFDVPKGWVYAKVDQGAVTTLATNDSVGIGDVVKVPDQENAAHWKITGITDKGKDKLFHLQLVKKASGVSHQANYGATHAVTSVEGWHLISRAEKKAKAKDAVLGEHISWVYANKTLSGIVIQKSPAGGLVVAPDAVHEWGADFGLPSDTEITKTGIIAPIKTENLDKLSMKPAPETGDHPLVGYMHPKSGKKKYPKIGTLPEGTMFHDKAGKSYIVKGKGHTGYVKVVGNGGSFLVPEDLRVYPTA